MHPLSVDPHPLLSLRAFLAAFPLPLGVVPAPLPDDGGPRGDAAVRAQVRELLRHGGFKPSGRNKPASEYLVRAAADGTFPVINAAVDVGNQVSLVSGLPISVVDADRLTAPWSVRVAPPGTTYPFNPSGQVFDAEGLVCVFDGDGVSATPVKDAQRSKTSPETTRVLCVVWGVAASADHCARVALWYQDRMRALGATVTILAPSPAAPA